VQRDAVSAPTRFWHPWRLARWAGAGALLLLPLLAMQFTAEVRWDLPDFAFAGFLVLVTGLLYELAARRAASPAYRAGAAVALATGFVLVWANAAVGVIGSEDNPANLMFHGVLAIGLLGALAARLRARGMALALAATAAAQVAADVVAVSNGWGFAGPVTVFFAALWLASAWLFRKAARQEVAV